MNTFYSTLEEMVSLLAGERFHDSWLSSQFRPTIKTAGSIDYYELLRKGKYEHIRSVWSCITSAERTTWVSAAGSLPAAMILYLKSAVNLSLIGIAPFSSYTPAGTPAAFQLSITELDYLTFNIEAAGLLTSVPANTSLLILATEDERPSRAFTNPNDYFPILSLPEGTDLLTPVNIITNWTGWFGQLRTNKRVCLKSCLISTINGARGPESIICAISTLPVSNLIINSDGTFVVDSDGTFITFP